MLDIVEFLEERKRENEDRAERLDEKERQIRSAIKGNEKITENIDLDLREQLNGVVNKRNELLAVADFVVELQEKYFD